MAVYYYIKLYWKYNIYFENQKKKKKKTILRHSIWGKKMRNEKFI